MVVRSGIMIRLFGTILGLEASAVAFFPFIFVAPKTVVTDRLLNHERIHLRQQVELLVLPFYIWYLIAYFRKGYRNVSFEREAYGNEYDLDYLKRRKPFSFFKYR